MAARAASAWCCPTTPRPEIALSSLSGETQSKSLISTGSAKTDGLSFALSGDVALPSSRTLSGQVVLIDRFGTNVLTWLDPGSGAVLGQLAVGTGFESNPSDYLELGDGTAVVSRFGSNAKAGSEAFDEGGDLLHLDLSQRVLLGNLVFESTEGLPPRPSSITRVADWALVSLTRVSFDFATTGDSELAGVKLPSLELAFRMRYQGLKNCGRPALSPSGKLLAVACTGTLDIHGVVANLDESALLLFDPSSMPPREIRRFAASELAQEPIQSGLVFAQESVLLFKTQTADNGVASNRWLSLDLDSASVTSLLEASPDAQGKGRGLLYGAMSCSPGCSELCLLADADRSALQRVRFDADKRPELLEPINVDAQSGLPPRDLIER
ncbi:MAG: hypothetical protein QM756_45055 [Polyangiaceae bacterium]